jgi:hypothetical protein
VNGLEQREPHGECAAKQRESCAPYSSFDMQEELSDEMEQQIAQDHQVRAKVRLSSLLPQVSSVLLQMLSNLPHAACSTESELAVA